MVLSTEYAFDLPRFHWLEMMSRLRRLSDRIHLVGYFRAPAPLYLSSMQQLVKYGDKIKDPYAPVNYRRFYTKAHNVGADAVDILPFRRSAFAEGCIFQDFLARYLQLSEETRHSLPTERTNESISAEGMELMRNFNTWRGNERRIPGDPVCKIILNAVQQGDADLALEPPRLFPSVYAAITQENVGDIAWLKDQANLVLDETNPTETAEARPPFCGPDDNLRKFVAINDSAVGKLRVRCLDILLREAAAAGGDQEAMVCRIQGPGSDAERFNAAFQATARFLLKQQKKVLKTEIS